MALLLQLFDFGYPEGVPPLNPEGTGPSLYDLTGKPIPGSPPLLTKQQCLKWITRCRATSCRVSRRCGSQGLKSMAYGLSCRQACEVSFSGTEGYGMGKKGPLRLPRDDRGAFFA